jgi:hypothetical protein
MYRPSHFDRAARRLHTLGNSASRPSPVFFDGTAMVLVDLRIEELAEMRPEPIVRAPVGLH